MIKITIHRNIRLSIQKGVLEYFLDWHPDEKTYALTLQKKNTTIWALIWHEDQNFSEILLKLGFDVKIEKREFHALKLDCVDIKL